MTPTKWPIHNSISEHAHDSTFFRNSDTAATIEIKTKSPAVLEKSRHGTEK